MGKYFDLSRFWKVIPLLNEYLPVTLKLGFMAILLGTFFGMVVATIRIFKVPILNRFFQGYVILMRGIPFVILVMLVYYYLPFFCQRWFGIDINRWNKLTFILIAFSLNEAAYMGEIFRGAFESVPKIQSEAGYSVGLTKFQVFIHIVLPQAVKVAIPPYGQNLVWLFDETSVTYIVGVQDFIGRAKTLSVSIGHQLESYIYIAFVYAIISIIIISIFKLIDKKYSFDHATNNK